ncbi:MAG TPA: hypothetical protein VIL60_06565 [Rhodanobacter sp.]
MTQQTTGHTDEHDPRRGVRRTVKWLAAAALLVYLLTFAQILLMK